ncbi:transcription initiation factor TFIID subunit 7-like [Copidosoma floridanum]|uniref:transcription initiation factor TFIID subunit 7-like n=1 Tax=Copidosoma floridanum TaxID=29053 RepID=UPI0006C9D1E1|nr:transcription initiation factor TFIID subunit 7-like [Copidosoma floridanum]
MLALIFRGVVFLGVVSWYSSSVWKAIDGIFKDQFQRYLDAEYKLNPRMREHVQRTEIDKLGSKLADPSVPSSLGSVTVQRLLETCDGLGDACTVDEAVTALDRSRDESMPPAESFETAPGAAGDTGLEEEKEVGRPVLRTDESAFQNGDAEPPDKRELPLEPGAIEFTAKENMGKTTKIDLENNALSLEPEPEISEQPAIKAGELSLLDPKEQLEDHSHVRPSWQAKNEPAQKNRKFRRGPLIGAKFEKVLKRREYIQVEDFGRKRRVIASDNVDEEEEEEDEEWENYKEYDRDFSEFDDESGEDERARRPVDGIAVAELPYRPAVDIYDLERLAAEEFCPLTLDDDPSCDETRAWP